MMNQNLESRLFYVSHFFFRIHIKFKNKYFFVEQMEQICYFLNS